MKYTFYKKQINEEYNLFFNEYQFNIKLIFFFCIPGQTSFFPVQIADNCGKSVFEFFILLIT